MKKREKFLLTIMILSSLNVGFWGWYQFDFVAWLFHSNTSWISRCVYALSGFSALYFLYLQVGKMKIMQRLDKDLLN